MAGAMSWFLAGSRSTRSEHRAPPLDEAPLRAELFSIAQLVRHTEQLARTHKVVARSGDNQLLLRLADTEKRLADAYKLLASAVGRGRQITPAAEWFVDNYHLIEEQIRTARRHFPRGYSRELPRLDDANGTPRVYDLALELISHSHGRIDLEAARAFVSSYQSVQPLTLGEVWAIPIMLRLALLENLRRVIARVTDGRSDRELAGEWVERLLEVPASDPSQVVLVLAQLIDAAPNLTNAFASELATRLAGQGPALVFPISWLEQRLAERGQTIEHAFELASQSQAADQVSIGNSITSLRFLGATDWRGFVESLNVVDEALRGDAVYASMDFATRDRYRHVIEMLARRCKSSELTVAKHALRLAAEQASPRVQHVGYFLIDRGRRALELAIAGKPYQHAVARPRSRRRLPLYLGAIAAVTAVTGGLAALDALTLEPAALVAWSIAAALCASQLAVSIVQWIATLVVHPNILPRLDFTTGIPDAHRTIVAVPTMFTSTKGIDELVDALEVRFLANRDPNLAFALVGDFRDAPEQHQSTDAALLQHAIDAIEALQRRYPDRGGGFFLFHRERRWNPRERAWMGWERKRGKLEDLNALLAGDPGRFSTVIGPEDRLRDIKYVIVLDSDTELPRDAASALVGTLAHPLNRPIFDPGLGRVTEGYSILQPRVAISLASAGGSRFARMYSGDCSIDPYTAAVSDVYQDLFGEGSFVGKGIYDLAAVRQSMTETFPENRILSHDLLEGAYGRAGLVSDVTLFEDYPSARAADASRRARWIRGDWQIARWLFRRVPVPGGSQRRRNPISRLSQWKILDNLRRSLVPIALITLVGFALVIPTVAVSSLLLVAATLFVPCLVTSLAALARRPEEVASGVHVRDLADQAVQQTAREAFAFACLPADAALHLTSIVVAGVRVLITKRNLLEWRTAADAQRSARTSLAGAYASSWISPAMGVVIAVASGLGLIHDLWLAAPIALVWLVAPALAWWVSRPLVAVRAKLSSDDRTFLRALARRTWRFFETYVSTEDNHLPPDNVQEDPPVGVAHRTSPTNIGLSLLANLAAYDFGYIASDTVIARTSSTFATLARLQRYRGHFYNWYDTKTLEPLRPMYVSTVDSGNLAGHLLTLASGLIELGEHRIVRDELLAGLTDTLDLLEQLGVAVPAARALLREPLPTLSAARERLMALSAISLTDTAGGEPAWWARAFESQCRDAAAELELIAPWIALEAPISAELRDKLDAIPTLAEVARLEATVASLHGSTDARVQQLIAAVALGAERATRRLTELRDLAVRATELGDHDYEFLYDRARHQFAIGYNVVDHRVDASFYDLLASEARLASFVAIAQDKVPQEHWFHLGRLVTTSRGGTTTLLSWSGSMFEYLMPMLVMPTYQGTLLDETCRGAVARQIEYGRERGVPWGVSESGYNKTDQHLNYQYRAFGVPGLGFKRGLADDLVIAPYACMMALMVAPEAACANLKGMAGAGFLGDYGFFEAIDYTASRLPPGKTSVIVQSYMAHHQGMALLSLVYLLADRPMQRRFEADLSLRATTLLLQERVPRAATVFPHPAEVTAVRSSAAPVEDHIRIFTTPNTATPEVHLLSNGHYHVAITNAGGGYSRWRDLAVTRWQEDATRDAAGTFCYLRDVTSGRFWSVAHQPTLRAATGYEAVFSQGRAEFKRRDEEITSHVEISVSPEDDIELRRITISNLGKTKRTLELTSFAEVVLATPAADAAHRAFSNLFVQTELDRGRHAILCTRRPRSGGEKPPWMLHLMVAHGATVGPTSFETNRAAFVGRGRSLQDPAAMHAKALTDSSGSVLDPIVAIRTTVELAPDQTIQLQVVTGVAETRGAAVALIDKYNDRHAAERVLELSWTQSHVLQRRLEATSAEMRAWERLAGHIIYLNPALRAPRSVIASNTLGQSGLWAYGISGDLPIVLVQISAADNLDLVRQLLRAHAYWRLKGLLVDLVIWNEDASGYRQNLHEQIMAAISSTFEASLVDRPGGVFLRRSDQMTAPDRVLLQTLARVIIDDTAGTLAEQLDRRPRAEPGGALVVVQHKRIDSQPVLPAMDRPDLTLFNGHGGFTQDGREYVIVTHRDSQTPAPWVNVLANSYFGTVISERGSAYTWCENAHQYRLTPWNNDPVSDPSGEVVYLRDEEDGASWSPTPSPAPGSAPYTTRHGFGYSIFETSHAGIASELRTFVATDAPAKFLLLKVRNHSGRPRRLSVTGMFELVLGSQRPAGAPHICTEVDRKTGALFAKNRYSNEFAGRIAFLECSEEKRLVTGDRLEFLGRNGTVARPAAMTRAKLSGRVGAGLDPCLAMQVTIDLADKQEREIVFLFGSGRDLADARHIVTRFRTTSAARMALEAVWAYWNHTLGALNVQTPDPTLNFLANGWLIYQVIACRMWGRSGFYQSGGAFGFRDQLQDAMALLYCEPALLREQIVRAAAHQFSQGDVQHWWHPPVGRGVRTRISDDYLWLPVAVCRYVNATGDTGVLDEKVEWLEGRPVTLDEDSYYDLPTRSVDTATLYEHCVRAIDNGLRFGSHGLPLMGTGDWNDGMNLVGDKGLGESVWLAFFLYDVLIEFAALARKREQPEYADRCLAQAKELQSNIEKHAWDGEWYRRAYFDEGMPMGSASSPECQIDSLPQSWAILSKAGDHERSRKSLAAVDTRLVDRDLEVIKLFDPPFDRSELEPGYIKGYVPGVRENGGQYTHAAVWAVMAFAAAGQTERAWELFRMINPANHGRDREAISTYKVEPYVVAADVYTNPQHAGRGGWTWYTGSAGWMYRLIVESLLGLHLDVDRLRIEPLLPAEWSGFDIHYRHHETVHHIHVTNLGGGGNQVARVVCDGVESADRTIPLVNDRQEHWVVVEVGGAT